MIVVLWPILIHVALATGFFVGIDFLTRKPKFRDTGTQGEDPADVSAAWAMVVSTSVMLITPVVWVFVVEPGALTVPIAVLFVLVGLHTGPWSDLLPGLSPRERAGLVWVATFVLVGAIVPQPAVLMRTSSLAAGGALMMSYVLTQKRKVNDAGRYGQHGKHIDVIGNFRIVVSMASFVMMIPALQHGFGWLRDHAGLVQAIVISLLVFAGCLLTIIVWRFVARLWSRLVGSMTVTSPDIIVQQSVDPLSSPHEVVMINPHKKRRKE